MEFIRALNLFLWVMAVAIIMYGIWLILRHTPKSKYRRYIIFMLLFWGLMSLSVYVFCVIEGQANLRFNQGILNPNVILLGMPCFFTLICYPIIALHPKLFTVMGWLKFTAPISILTIIYIIYHKVTGLDPYSVVPSIGYAWQNIGQPTVYLRFLIVLVTFAYEILVLRNLWDIVPSYKKYSENNFSDSAYDISWMKELVSYISVLCIAYNCLVFSTSIYVNTFYTLSLILTFSFFIEKLIFTRSLDDLHNLGLIWSFKTGWQVNEEAKEDAKKSINLAPYYEKLEEWMKESKLYTKQNLTTQDIIDNFPELTNADIPKILKSNGETFHSYIQRHRVNRACQIIEKHKGKTNLKRLSSEVGFSHYSSFSRSFVQIVGVSPSEYIAKQNVKINL